MREWIDKHKGKDFLVLGCGPSSYDYNPKEHTDKIIIAVNRAFLKEPRTHYQISIDRIWKTLKEQKENRTYDRLVNGKFTRFVQFVLRKECPYKAVFFARVKNLMCYPKFIEYAQKKKSIYAGGLFSHGTSAHPAMHLAAIMGAKRIFLCGVDATHTYNTPRVQKGYHILKQVFDSIGMQVINLSTISTIDAFPRYKEHA